MTLFRPQGCKPDGITFSALIAAYEKGGQWVRALKAHENMLMQVIYESC